MSRVRVCFLGTPEFAVRCLDELLSDDHYEVVGVITQPDRPAGRNLKLQPSAVKLRAQELGLTCISPESVNTTEIRDIVAAWKCEVAVVVAFGQLLGVKFLELFPFGAVNIHGSLLPRWRGAAPIQRAIEAGDAETGVALQRIVKKLDAGDVIGVRKIDITDDLDAANLFDKLADLGAELLHVELMDYIRGQLSPEPQDEDLVTYAHKIDKSESWIDWSQSARAIFNKTRAFVAGPGVKTQLEGKPLKIHKMKIISEPQSDPLNQTSTTASGLQQPETARRLAGEIVEVSEQVGIVVACGEGLVALTEVQPESKKRMLVADFLRGQKIEKGMRFTSP